MPHSPLIGKKNNTKKKSKQQILEAILFSSATPINLNQLCHYSKLSIKEVSQTVEELNSFYHESDRAFRIYKLEQEKNPAKKGSSTESKKARNKTRQPRYQLRTLPELSQFLSLSPSAKLMTLAPKTLETLTIIAYLQPTTRFEIEKIRGVDSSYCLSRLLEKGLIRTKGRSPLPGRPLFYATSPFFLEVFGLDTIEDLPQPDELNLNESTYSSSP